MESLKERLPESEETVLVYAYCEEDGDWCYATGTCFALDDDDDANYGCCFDNEVLTDDGYKAVAWMPIPQYKEESK